jgi:hypothetical protein
MKRRLTTLKIYTMKNKAKNKNCGKHCVKCKHYDYLRFFVEIAVCDKKSDYLENFVISNGFNYAGNCEFYEEKETEK